MVEEMTRLLGPLSKLVTGADLVEFEEMLRATWSALQTLNFDFGFRIPPGSHLMRAEDAIPVFNSCLLEDIPVPHRSHISIPNPRR